LENYYLYHAVLGDFLEKNNRCAEALEHYKKARNLTRALAEKKFLDAKIERISNEEK
jgi:RNA polymerase sigma-70 factor (ECF subfamily)